MPAPQQFPDITALIEKCKYRSNAAYRTSQSNGGMVYWDGVAEAYDSIVKLLKELPDAPPQKTELVDTYKNIPAVGLACDGVHTDKKYDQPVPTHPQEQEKDNNAKNNQ